jgi:two-component system NarL family sensor kinase
MDQTQIIFSICFISVLLVLLIGFLLFMLMWQRRRNNSYISEKEAARAHYNEQLLKAQLEIQEQTFNMISMEIHDNVGQTLSLLMVQLNIMEQREQLDRPLMAEARESVSKAMTDLRDLAKSMSTERVQHSNLQEMTAHEVRRMSNTGGIQVELSTEGEEYPLKNELKLIVFRMIQECFQNINKHAEATLLNIIFTYTADFLTIIINDNGKGFDEEILLQGSAGLGIKNVISRAAMIGGAASIKSTINEGTTVIITTPYA